MPPNCAGASSATIRNSSRRLASDTSRDADGAASITTPPCALRLTDSWSPKGRRFPPQDHVEPLCSRNLPFPTVTDPEDPPLRPERHIPNSIATMRRRLADAIIKTLQRCRVADANGKTSIVAYAYDTVRLGRRPQTEIGVAVHAIPV